MIDWFFSHPWIWMPVIIVCGVLRLWDWIKSICDLPAGFAEAAKDFWRWLRKNG